MVKTNDRISRYAKEFPFLLDSLAHYKAIFKCLKAPVIGRILIKTIRIDMAARLAGVSTQEFTQFIWTVIGEKAGCLDFKQKKENSKVSWVSNNLFENKKEIILDVRPNIEKGEDPFKVIMQGLSNLDANEFLTLINYFEPVPLYQHLKEKGFDYRTLTKGSFFYISIVRVPEKKEKNSGEDSSGFYQISQKELEAIENSLKNKHPEKLQILDVSELPAPEPMLKIVEALSIKPEPLMVKVTHRKLPLHLPGFFKDKPYLVSAYENKDHVVIYVFKKILLENTHE